MTSVLCSRVIIIVVVVVSGSQIVVVIDFAMKVVFWAAVVVSGRWGIVVLVNVGGAVYEDVVVIGVAVDIVIEILEKKTKRK